MEHSFSLPFAYHNTPHYWKPTVSFGLKKTKSLCLNQIEGNSAGIWTPYAQQAGLHGKKVVF